MKKFSAVVKYVKENRLEENLSQISQEQVVNELLHHLRYLSKEEIEKINKAVIAGTANDDVITK